MNEMRHWWAGLSQRERMLIGVMGVLIAIVAIWLGIARPVESGLQSAREAQAAALDRNVAMRAKVKALQAPQTPAAGAAGPLDQMIGQSAGDAGFTLERVQAQGENRAEIAIASARPTALFGWLAAIEGQGVVVESLTVQPSTTTGTLTVRAVLKKSGQ